MSITLLVTVQSFIKCQLVHSLAETDSAERNDPYQ
ncbi:hypothetical protein C369_02728 [Cryptococcus neoformans A5-35-17]|nr:hypothetical protein C369_02728 [Cryptococcus neoformans var. grubii A5-35-17]